MGVPLRANAEIAEGRLQDRQQPMDPMIRLRLAQVKEFAQDDLQRIGLEVDQYEQGFLLRSMQESLAPSAGRTLAGLAGNGLVGRIQSLIEARQKAVNSRWNSGTVSPVRAKNFRRSLWSSVNVIIRLL